MKGAVCLAACLAVVLGSSLAAPAVIDLSGEWSLTGADINGTQWTAVLYITQSPQKDGRCPLRGLILWQATGGSVTGTISAWEDFEDGVYGTQSYFDPQKMVLHVEGYKVRDISSNGLIQPAVTAAKIDASGKKMIEGTGTGPGMVPGSWQGERVADAVSITIDPGVVSGESVVFTMHLSGPASQPVSVDHVTVDDTAVAGWDYVDAIGTYVFPVGQTTATIPVQLLGNRRGGAIFYMQLSNPKNAILETSKAICTIPFLQRITPDAVTRGLCGQDVGAGNLLALYAVCWAGLASWKWGGRPRR